MEVPLALSDCSSQGLSRASPGLASEALSFSARTSSPNAGSCLYFNIYMCKAQHTKI